MLKGSFKSQEVYYEICIVMVIATLCNCFKVWLLLFIECHIWGFLALSQMLQKAKSAFVCVRKREIESEWYTEAKKGIKVFVHKKGWDYRSRKEICSIWSNPSFMSSFDTESLFLSFFSVPGWKKSGFNNQRLATAGEFLLTFLLYSCIVWVTPPSHWRLKSAP